MVTFKESKAFHVLAKEVSKFPKQRLVQRILLDLLNFNHQLLILGLG